MLASQQVRNEANEVTSGNLTYTTYQPIWQALMESYMGGEDYRQARNLVRYQLENDGEYAARLRNAALENHCKSVIQVYTSFLFRQQPQRELGSLLYDPLVEALLEDADYEGRSLDNFMKQVATWSSVFGHCWITVHKPNIGAQTLADEYAAGLRPYLCLLTPLAVLDWQYTRTPIGSYELSYFKYLEDVNGTVKTVKIWTKDTIQTIDYDEGKKSVSQSIEEPNQLGMIPAVIAYSTKGPVRGLGISDISDIADVQRFIYNCISEIDQSIRLDSHPSLVATTEVQVGTGAGALISLPDNMDAALKPYVLDFGGANVGNILQVINHMTEVVDKMANTGAIRTTETRTNSGIAIQTEFELLNARLAEKADNLELAEEQIWKIIARYMGVVWDGSINYPDSFNIRDDTNELSKLSQAKTIATDPKLLTQIDLRLAELMDFDSYYEGQASVEQEEEHATTTTENRSAHIQQMIMDGYTDEDILRIHPEISEADILAAKQQLLGLERS